MKIARDHAKLDIFELILESRHGFNLLTTHYSLTVQLQNPKQTNTQIDPYNIGDVIDNMGERV